MQWGGNLGAPPQPPWSRSNISASASIVSAITVRRHAGLVGALERGAGRDRGGEPLALLAHLLGALAPGLVDRVDHHPPTRHAGTLQRREVGAGEERLLDRA